MMWKAIENWASIMGWVIIVAGLLNTVVAVVFGIFEWDRKRKR